jgi:hypothetical protein
VLRKSYFKNHLDPAAMFVTGCPGLERPEKKSSFIEKGDLAHR